MPELPAGSAIRPGDSAFARQSPSASDSCRQRGFTLQRNHALTYGLLQDRAAHPQRKIHLQLLWPLIADHTADMRFVFRSQTANFSGRSTPLLGFQARRPLFLVMINHLANRRPRQHRPLDYLHRLVTRLVQTD